VGLVPIATNDQVPTSFPLSNLEVSVKIHDFIVETELKQTYTNTENSIVQCQYVFPLYEGAAVTAFTAKIGDKTLIAKLFTKE